MFRAWLEAVRARAAGLRSPPPRRSWIVGEDGELDRAPPEPGRVRAALSGLVAARRRVLRAAALLTLAVDLALGVLLYSNIWYMNLFLYAFLVPNFLVMFHYLGLTRKS